MGGTEEEGCGVEAEMEGESLHHGWQQSREAAATRRRRLGGTHWDETSGEGYNEKSD